MDVKIKDEIAKKLQKRVDSSDEFGSVEEYVNFVLDQIVQKLDDKSDGSDQKQENYSEEDEEKVKERLRSLGYLE